MMSERERRKATTPKDLAEQFRELKILRAKVRQAEAELSRKPRRSTEEDRDLEIDRFAGASPSRSTSTKRN